MIISLEKLIKGQVDILDLNFSQKIDNINYCGKSYKITNPVEVKGKITKTGEKMYLDCEIKLSILDYCSRCLKELEIDLEYPVKGFLVKDEEDVLEDEDTFVYNGDELDFKDIIEDTFILNVPQKVLCDEDCKGLCPSCGANLNEEECKCHDDKNDKEFIDPRFAKLKDFFKND
ncbi:YceD family protein [Tepidibacter formicigenes]|jgi:uncharacterized protein|uniref:DUF177 domain-containing protein n=1 Tax=Tepidibacter formicigenes DSM 15518 TaxID=1123349 RepID=A0A1M6L4T3_9FIRM|nr:DUF177 domain-containing protein [Tepidibacter formicigenes]SHJ66114.1 uncharacterized protein SAMN02744037_00556 [Tepidibacter formicigenes DSM 15518]